MIAARRAPRVLALLALALSTACGDGPSGADPNPAPVILAISPAETQRGTAEAVITVTGSSFIPQSVARFNGADRPTVVVSGTELRARLSAADLADAGPAQITVFTPAPGGGVSGAAQFMVVNPGPSISLLTPNVVTAASPGATVTIIGTGFVPQSQVMAGTVVLETAFGSATELRVTLTEAQIAAAGLLNLRVQNPPPGGGSSADRQLEVRAPVPTIASLAPAFVVTGADGVTVAVIGTGFVTQAVVLVNGAPRQTTRISASELRITLTPAEVAAAGTLAFQVRNPGLTSNAVSFELRAPVPAITSLATPQTEAGQPSFELRVNGTGFAANSEVRFNGAARPTRRVSPTQLQATLNEGDLQAAGTFDITVTTPAPGGGASNSAPLVIVNGTPRITLLPSSGASAGRQGFTLMVHGGRFAAGSVVRWNGADRPTTYLSSSRVAASITAADVASPGPAQVSVHNPAPGGGTSAGVTIQVRAVGAAAVTSLREVPIPARDVVWSPATGLLYASVPSTAAAHGNSVVAIDPATGAVTGSAFVGSEPGVMGVSDDGQMLYVFLRGTNTIRRVALPTLAPGLEFAALSGIEEIHVMPGTPGTIAATRGEACLYDNGVRRAQCSPAGNTIAFGEDGAVLYGHNTANTGFEFRTIAVLANGLQELRVTNGLIGGHYTRMRYASGRLYASNGPVVDAERHVRVGTLGSIGFGVAVAPDAVLGRVFVLNEQGTVTAYDMNHFTSLGSVSVSFFQFEHPTVWRRIVRWGSDGLAFGDTRKIYILRTPLAGS